LSLASGKGVSVKTEIGEIVISKVGLSKKCDGDILLTGNRTALLMLFHISSFELLIFDDI
jgi:hypothetical protein